MIKYISNIFSILSLLCLSYYIIIRWLKGGSDVLWIWPLATCIFGILSILPRLNRIFKVKSIGLILNGSYIVTIVGMIIFFLLELIIFYNGLQKSEKEVDYILVLGNGLKDGEISTILQQRLDTAYGYYKKNPESKFILSGGKSTEGEGIAEADAMEKYLLDLKIEESKIIKENQSQTTYENIYFTSQIISTNDSLLIVTSNFHLWRAMRLAKNIGLNNIYGLASPTDIVLVPYYYIRESGAVILDKWKGNL